MPATHITDQQFESQVLKSDLPVMVDFWAPWCGPCQMAAPVLDQLADQYQDKLKILKVNVDEQTQSAAKFGVMSIPTVVLFNQGKEMDRQVGFAGEAGYQQLIQKVLK
jgi:thioredoxin 1